MAAFRSQDHPRDRDGQFVDKPRTGVSTAQVERVRRAAAHGDQPHPAELLSRDEFRAAVLGRHGGRCCVPGCGHSAEDAHHIIERRLWVDGGYYLANGAALCGRNGQGHHIDAKRTLLAANDLRRWSGINEVLLPEHLVADADYDAWGNEIRPDGSRSPGELFWEPQVQRLLGEADLLGRFDLRPRYPRTLHLPDSPGMASDDKVLADLSAFEGVPLVVTEKADGENTNWTRDDFWARSPDSNHHPTRDYVKAMWGARRWDIPPGIRISGENLYARHSIAYDDLPDFFLVFGVWDRGTLLPWEETEEWAQLLDLHTVPVLYRGESLTDARRAWAAQRNTETSEGFVLRTAGRIEAADFRTRVAKWVRPQHVRTADHGWRHRSDHPVNGLRSSSA